MKPKGQFSTREALEAVIESAIRGDINVLDWGRSISAFAAPEVKTRPVRVDLRPVVHKALRKAAAEKETSMAALARQIISEQLGFKDDGK